MPEVSERQEIAAAHERAARREEPPARRVVNAVAPRTVRVGVLGTGRIGSMHAELLARRVPGASLAAVYDVDAERRGTVARRARRRGGRRAGRADRARPTSTRSRSARARTRTSTLIDAAAAAGKAERSARSRSRSTSPRSTGRSRRSSAPASCSRSASTGASTPRTASVRDAVAAGAVGDVHLVRITSRDPAPPPLDVRRALGRASSST